MLCVSSPITKDNKLTESISGSVIQFIVLICGVAVSFFPDEFDKVISPWLQSKHHNISEAHWPSNISRNTTAVGCHSHNDYWREVPLLSALQAGCISIEADIWRFDPAHQSHPGDLYVGHTTSSLRPDRTLRNMYIDPLVKLLDEKNPIASFYSVVGQPPNGVFDGSPAQSLVLLVDIKTDSTATWNDVVDSLAPLRQRGYLTYFNGVEVVNRPVTVVGTGNTPFNLVTANADYRDIFFDAPLHYLADSTTAIPKNPLDDNNAGQGLTGTPPNTTPSSFNSTNSFYASTSFKDTIGLPRPFHLSTQQVDSLRAQIRGAHRQGLKVRYWGVPGWPRSLRDYIWDVLVREGVDVLNVDDLQSVSRIDG